MVEENVYKPLQFENIINQFLKFKEDGISISLDLKQKYIHFILDQMETLHVKVRMGKTPAIPNNMYHEADYWRQREDLINMVFYSHLPTEVVIEARDDLPKDERIKITANILSKLQEHSIPSYTIFSGGKSFHIHIFIDPQFYLSLPDDIFQDKQKGKLKIGKTIPEMFVMWFSRKAQIRLDNTTLDMSLLTAAHTQPFPESHRKDKPDPTAFVFPPLPKEFKTWQPPSEFKDFILSFEIHPVGDIQSGEGSIETTTKALMGIGGVLSTVVSKKIVERLAKVGARKGERDNSAVRVYYMARVSGMSHDEAKQILQKFLKNSEPKGEWDDEKQHIFEKADKYWKDKVDLLIAKGGYSYKIAVKKLRTDPSFIEEVANLIASELLKYIISVKEVNDGKGGSLYFETTWGGMYPVQTEKGTIDYLRAFLNISEHYRVIRDYHIPFLKSLIKEMGRYDLVIDLAVKKIFTSLEVKKKRAFKNILKPYLHKIEGMANLNKEFANKNRNEKIEYLVNLAFTTPMDDFLSSYADEKKIPFNKLLSGVRWLLEEKDGAYYLSKEYEEYVRKHYEEVIDDEETFETQKEKEEANGDDYEINGIL